MKNKEIEILYRKYGGHLRCKRAARVIQLAYREYRLRKNYFKLCESNLKRRSFDMSESIKISDNRKLKSRQPVSSEFNANETSNKFKIDLPSVDFEHLVEQYNSKNTGM